VDFLVFVILRIKLARNSPIVDTVLKMRLKMKTITELMAGASDINKIRVEEAMNKLNDTNVKFIDVSDKVKFDDGTIENATNLNRGILEFYLAKNSFHENDYIKYNSDNEYIVFCLAGPRDALATKTMKEMGYNNVKNLIGGYKA